MVVATDYPPGKWTPLLIGLQWPSSSTLMLLSNAIRQRLGVATGYSDLADQLTNALFGPLAGQEGVTAEATRTKFTNGRDHAQAVTDKNTTKSNAYSKAHQAVADLQSELRTIAKNGNDAIAKLESSKDPTKIAQIVQIIMEAQTQANTKAAARSADIFDGIQAVLRQDGIDLSAREFTKSLGYDLAKAFGSPGESDITKQVTGLLGAGLPQAPAPPPASPSDSPIAMNQNAASPALAGPPTSGPIEALPDGPESLITNSLGPSTVGVQQGVVETPVAVGQNAFTPVPNPLPAAQSPTPSVTPTITAPTTTSPVPTTSTPSFNATTPQAPSTPSFQPLTPQQLVENFSTGAQAGAPFSDAGQSFTQSFASTFQPPVMQQPDLVQPQLAGAHAPVTAPTSGGYFEIAAAQHDSGLTPFPAAPIAAAPIAAMPGVAAPTATPVGPLPAYGADLRPAVSTVAAPPPPAPSATSPTSAPVNPSAAGTALGQPAVVQKATAHSGSTPHAVGITENAVAATTAGALAGTASAESAAHQRLRTVVEAMARQQPGLRWAAAERADGTTILVTDLASGWIPPDLEIPAGVRLLEPGQQRSELDALLGEVTASEAWHPGQYLPPAKDAPAPSMSLRARDLPTVDDLNWHLTQVANWRDGLPRLAHTLAKAAIAGTGVLDSETDLLHQHLRTIANTVLSTYPDSADTTALGNWLLLAAIDALVAGRRTALNYHFAWFQALTMATQRGAR